MALVNHVKREINAKIVYCGPPLSGKSTSIRTIHRKLKPEFRGELKTMAIRGDQMLFFEFTPPGGGVEGYTLRLHIYTAPGQVTDPSVWKIILKGVDGVIFVADSSAAAAEKNHESLDLLDGLLQSFEEGGTIPRVFQYNRRDAADALPVEEMESLLNQSNFPAAPTVAAKGEGVVNVLSALLKQVIPQLREAAAAPYEELGVPALEELEPEHPEEDRVLAEPAHEPPAAWGGEPEIETGLPEAVPGGISLPLTVRCGERVKRFALNLTLTDISG